MINLLRLLGVITVTIIVVSASQQAFASSKGYVEFFPANRSVNTGSALKPAAISKTSAAFKTQPVYSMSDTHLSNLILQTVSNLLAQGILKGEKGDKGDPGVAAPLPTAISSSPEITGFQQAYLPGAIVADDGTYFSATHLSATDLSVDEITISKDAHIQGAATIANLSAGSLTTDSGAYLSEGGDWVNASSMELKENLVLVDSKDVLTKIANLPIYTWNYKAQNAEVLHISPVAEDFHAAFGLGGADNNKAISTIDPAGVALAGIQALNQKLESILNFESIAESLKKLGVEIREGLVKVKDLTSEFIKTKDMEVGSPEHRSGIVIYDRTTGEPMCIFSENGTLKSEPGKCKALGEAPALQDNTDSSLNEAYASNPLPAAEPNKPATPNESLSDSSEQAPFELSITSND